MEAKKSKTAKIFKTTAYINLTINNLRSVMLSGMVLCECHSPGEDKLVLGCADGTLVSGLP